MTDDTCGLQEAVDERGVQPPEPLEKCVTQKGPSGSLVRQKGMDGDDGEEKNTRPDTSSSALRTTTKKDNSNSSSSTTIKAQNMIMKERIWFVRVADEIAFQPLHTVIGALLHSEHAQGDANLHVQFYH